MTGIRQSWLALALAIAAVVGVSLAFVVAALVLAEGIPPEGWGYSGRDIALQVSVGGGTVPVIVLMIASAAFAVSALQRTTFREVRVRSFVAIGLVVLAVLLAILPTVAYFLMP